MWHNYLINLYVAAYKKINENVKVGYADAQAYVTNYWRGIRVKPIMEHIANDNILECNKKSLNRKSLLLY